jgi:hypothetical protein
MTVAPWGPNQAASRTQALRVGSITTVSSISADGALTEGCDIRPCLGGAQRCTILDGVALCCTAGPKEG